MKPLVMLKPDDGHLHLRDGDKLSTTVKDSAKRFQRAIIMPNLQPPVCSIEQAYQYYERILSAVPSGLTFQPLMTLYLTEHTTVEDIRQAKQSQFIQAYKLYPAGATTHSSQGINNLEKIFFLFEAMAKYDLPLLIHGEVTDEHIDIFERERVFIDTILVKIVKSFPSLRIVLEHITTAEATAFIEQTTANVAATITIHHLLLTRNHLLAGGIRPHLYCLPILKTYRDQQALLAAATSGNPKFFLGTDSAPHERRYKEHPCGCAGIYSAHAALELYATVFEQAGALDKLENFASKYMADFYQLPYNTEKISLHKSAWKIPQYYSFGESQLIPLLAGETINWAIG